MTIELNIQDLNTLLEIFCLNITKKDRSHACEHIVQYCCSLFKMPNGKDIVEII
jgi:hypothetical protein